MGIYYNGTYIPESALNVFYRGSQGKATLAIDAGMDMLAPITEIERSGLHSPIVAIC